MSGKFRGRRERIAAFFAVVIALGVVALTASGSSGRAFWSAAPPGTNLKVSAPTAVPAAAQPAIGAPALVGAPVPAAVPAASGVAATSASGVAASSGAGPAAAADAQRSAAAVSGGQPASALPDTSAQILDRMVIRTAQLGVEVSDMEQALAQVRAIASRGGGFVSASNTHIERVNDQDRTVADLTLQVRSDSADQALSDLRSLGKVTSETSGSQDVTDEYVDVDSNLRNLQASEAAILKLMDRATQIQDVLALQRELTNVRGQIERIQGRTDMATISISLRLPPVQASETTASGAWDPVGVALRGWQASLTLLRGVAEVVIVAVAFSWWLVPMVALGVYVWQHRRRQATPAAPVEA
jgi:hypothetical protein